VAEKRGGVNGITRLLRCFFATTINSALRICAASLLRHFLPLSNKRPSASGGAWLSAAANGSGETTANVEKTANQQ